MAGRGYITDNYKSSIKDVYLLTPTGTMEQARNPLNKYSTIRKQLDLQSCLFFCKGNNRENRTSIRAGSECTRWQFY